MKQRLIDANDVLKLIPPEEFNSKFAVISSPTVEAIPVEWIEKWEQKDENFFLYMGLTKKLIEDWEAENE